MLRTYKVEALVLRRIKKGEADSYFTLLTRYHGRIRVIAKGIRKESSRKAPFFDLFNYLTVFLAKGKALDIVTDISPLENFKVLKTDIRKIATAFKLVELTDNIIPENEPHREVFEELLTDLKKLNLEGVVNGTEIVENYSRFLLHQLGYLPKNEFPSGNILDSKLEEIMEKKIKSNSFISKLI